MNEIMIYNLNGDSVTSLVQWDKNVTLCISEPDITTNYNVHFFNQCSPEAHVMESKIIDGTLQVKVPNILLTEPYTIVGYVYKEDIQEGRSIYGFKIAVRNRPKPTDYVYVESDEYVTFAKVLAECLQYANNSSDSATLSKSYAVGGTKTRVGEDTDNAKFYSETANAHATSAKNSKDIATQKATAASQSADNAKLSEGEAKNAQTNSENSAKKSQSYAIGGTNTRTGEDTDNSKYYSQQAKASADASKTSETNAQKHEQAAASSASAASTSEANAKGSEASAKNIADQVALEKQQIDTLVKEHLVAETQNQLAEIKKYLQEIQAAKDGLTLHVSGGDAFSFDVQNIHGGNAVTVDNYKYITGSAISIV